MNKQNPFQGNNIDNAFDIHPAAVKTWIENLPLGSTGETSKQIYCALKQINQQNNRLIHHLEYLEAISPTQSLFLLY